MPYRIVRREVGAEPTTVETRQHLTNARRRCARLQQQTGLTHEVLPLDIPTAISWYLPGMKYAALRAIVRQCVTRDDVVSVQQRLDGMGFAPDAGVGQAALRRILEYFL